MTNKYKNEIICIAFTIAVFAFTICIGLFLKTLNVNVQYHKGTLAVYDLYGTLKYTFEGDFKVVDNNTFYDRETGTYYSFANMIFREG